ncbi:restriction endonuclease subunit S [Pseudomonas sp. R2-7-07]|uniref:restriction endonuclease subunit S n=1 Tax=Pseudomonas sp. R2-7-07 TaxID=658641 RepID=UPI000F587927|nr:restriction endonuclease subunit S [Pseudomonas sp. R2-7-07]AZF45467.1 Type I restriction-modification system, specificity subunit S [Pseudomonas sp. R2-7-07]
MSKFPQGWSSAPLGGVTTAPDQKVPDVDEVFTYIDIGAINRADKTVATSTQMRGADAPSRARKVVREGDTLVSMTRPNLNAVALIPAQHDGAIASTGFDVLRPCQDMDPRWINYLVRTEAFVKSMSSLVQGALYPAIRSKDVRAFIAPIAPLAEQSKIADKLDVLIARVQVCKKHLDALPNLLKRYRQSVLGAATSGDLTSDWREERTLNHASDLLDLLKGDHEANGGHAKGNAAEPSDGVHNFDGRLLPKSWAVATLRDLCEPGRPITYGILKPGPELDVGVPYIRVADFPGNRLQLELIRKTSAAIDEQFKRSRLRPGDLILSIRGTVGRLIEVPDELDGANITQDTARLSINPRIERRYVYFSLLESSIQLRMQKAIRGVAVKGINIGDVRALQLPVPPLDEQLEIVRRVDSLFSFADCIDAHYAEANAKVQRLTLLLLSKAFRGELVPQDPNNESASALLARIAARRASAVAKPRVRKIRQVRPPRAPKETATMTKSRHDDDVKGKAYLADHLRRLNGSATAESLFKLVQLPVADFYKQLAWEVAQGYVKDNTNLLELGHAAG